ncbi:MAG: hypothetical protein ACR2H2_08910 [Solirubrobacteraceae bacterium]
MKVLFWMSHAGFSRNFESLLRELDARDHEVEVALERDWPRGAGDDDAHLRRLERELPGLRLGLAPARPPVGPTATGRHLRAGLDYLRFLDPAYATAVKPRERAAAHVPRALVHAAARPGARPALRWLLSAAERAVPVEAATRAFISARAPDLVCLTPLIDLGSPQTDVVRAARELRIPSALCVASWDNLTMRGGIHDAPDLVAVWNEAQRAEAVDLHGVPAERVVVVGAGAYDHWFGWRPGNDREPFCVSLGLDPAQAIVLYVGSSGFIAPGEDAFVLDWAREVRADAALEGVQLLVRPHPLNAPSAQGRAALEALGGVVVHPPRGANPTSAIARQAYFDSIFHSAAVVGVNTSAFLEAAIVGRPIHTVLDDRYRATQEGTLHFRHLLPATGGALRAASTFDEHRRQLAAALSAGPEAAERDFVAAFVRPCGIDRPAGELVAAELERAARASAASASPAPRAGRAPAAAALLAVRGHARWRRR